MNCFNSGYMICLATRGGCLGFTKIWRSVTDQALLISLADSTSINALKTDKIFEKYLNYQGHLVDTSLTV